MHGGRGVAVRRFVARAVDEAFVLALQGAFVLVAAVLGGLSGLSSDEDQAEVLGLAAGIAACGWVLGVIYEVGSTRRGPSVGKRWLRLRVRDATTGTAPSRRQALLRWLLVVGVQPSIWLAVFLGGGESTVARIGLVAVIAASVLWRLVLAVSIIRGPGPGAVGLHDQLAGTCVIRAGRPGR